MKKIFWGLLFILSGAFLVTNQLGYLGENLNVFSIIFTIFLIPVFISSLFKRNFFASMLSLGLLTILYKGELNLDGLSNFVIILTAILMGIGLHILFGKHCKCHNEHFDKIINDTDSSEVNLDVSFGSSIKYVNTDNFLKANIKCSFGAIKMYFDNANIADDSAVINLDVSFAGVELFIPKDWKIINKVDVTLGAVEQKNTSSKTNKTVILSGNVSLGGIEIMYI